MGKNDSSILLMTAIASAFAALTGAPAASAIFAVEIAIIGSVAYSALIPCVFGAVSAYWTTRLLGLAREHYIIDGVSSGIDISALWKVAVIGICSAIASIMFCRATEYAHKYYKKYFKSGYIRIIVGGLLVAGITLLLGTDIYSGAGYSTIEHAFISNDIPLYVPFIKLALTALTLGAGFRGGEILPAFYIGSTLGSSLAVILGLEPSFGAALGYVAVFCGVTNCPLAALILAAELFSELVHAESVMLYFCVAIALSYILSGYVGLYPAQVYYQPKLHLRRYRKAEVKNATELE
jgi:H+/Cl- antiporter ClcA